MKHLEAMHFLAGFVIAAAHIATMIQTTSTDTSIDAEHKCVQVYQWASRQRGWFKSSLQTECSSA